MTDVNDLINALGTGDNVSAEDIFGSLMNDKINSAMDDRKIELAQGMMGVESEVEDIEYEEPEVEASEDIYDDPIDTDSE